MNNTVKVLLLTGAGIVICLILIGGGFLLGRSTSMVYQNPLSENYWWQRSGEWGCNLSSFGHRGMRPGWMGGYRSQAFPAAGEILSMEETEQIVQNWLADANISDLEIAEVMIFDNHAYVMIVEESTGIGAMEILVDPDSRSVYPEHGPNMMWNLKYSTMGLHHRTAWSAPANLNPQDIEKMPVTPGEAVAAAQDFLDDHFPGRTADDHAAVFYGYYTLHILEDDHEIGMLSVNGYTAEVFFHSWHGELLEINGH